MKTNEELAESALAAHQYALHPVRKPVEPWPADGSRWCGTRGISPRNDSERKLLEACDRDRVPWAEKKQRLERLREEMVSLKPAQPIQFV